ncbi:MAG: hypothetical protein ACJ0O5_00570 [Flavobacteriaceae bacterium]
MDNIKRRSFLKNSSILTGSLVLPSFSFKKTKTIRQEIKNFCYWMWRKRNWSCSSSPSC